MKLAKGRWQYASNLSVGKWSSYSIASTSNYSTALCDMVNYLDMLMGTDFINRQLVVMENDAVNIQLR